MNLTSILSDNSTTNALIVDDGETNLLVLESLLNVYGIQPDKALSGSAAVDMAKKKDYNFIIMDYLMPDMDGVVATELIQKYCTENPSHKMPDIVGVSATPDESVRIKFVNAGALDLIRKPPLESELKPLIGKYFSTTTSVITDNSPATSSSDDIFNSLSSINGLDYKHGVSMLGGRQKDYMMVLTACVKNISEQADVLTSLTKHVTDTENYIIPYHSLKGIFLNIAADELGDRSKTLEFAARENNSSLISEQFDSYLNDIRQFVNQLKEITDNYNNASKPVRLSTSDNQSINNSSSDNDSSNMMYLSELESLCVSIEDYEFIDVIEKLENLRTICPAEHLSSLDKINSQVQDFDYTAALITAEALKNA